MDLIAQIKALIAVANAAQCLYIRGYRGGIDPCITSETWNALQAAIAQLPDDMRLKSGISYAGFDLT